METKQSLHGSEGCGKNSDEIPESGRTPGTGDDVQEKRTKIGISYITYQRPALWKFGFERLLRTLEPYTGRYDIKISISDDASDCVDTIVKIAAEINTVWECICQSGKLANISKNRNRSLSQLLDCDYIFFLEDDIYPIDPKWLDGYISVLKEKNFGHVMYLPGSIFPNQSVFATVNDLTVMKNNQCGGIMLGVRKDILDKIGGFYAEFGPYGFEHAEFTERCNKAQGLPGNLYLSIKEAEDQHWFVSADEFNHTAFSADLTVEQFREINRGSIGQRLNVDEIKKSISYNGQIWQKSRKMSNSGNLHRSVVWE